MILPNVDALRALTSHSIVIPPLDLEFPPVVEIIANNLELIEADSNEETITSLGVAWQHTYHMPTTRAELVALSNDGAFDADAEYYGRVHFFSRYIILGSKPEPHFVYGEFFEGFSILGGPKEFVTAWSGHRELTDYVEKFEDDYLDLMSISTGALPPFFALNDWIRRTPRPVMEEYRWGTSPNELD